MPPRRRSHQRRLRDCANKHRRQNRISTSTSTTTLTLCRGAHCRIPTFVSIPTCLSLARTIAAVGLLSDVLSVVGGTLTLCCNLATVSVVVGGANGCLTARVVGSSGFGTSIVVVAVGANCGLARWSGGAWEVGEGVYGGC
jgi:hypothetical protein